MGCIFNAFYYQHIGQCVLGVSFEKIQVGVCGSLLVGGGKSLHRKKQLRFFFFHSPADVAMFDLVFPTTIFSLSPT